MQLIKQISKRIIWILIGVIISQALKSPKEAPQEEISFKNDDSLKVELSVKDSLLKSKLDKRESTLKLKEAKTSKDTIYIYKEIIKQDSVIIRDFIEIADLRDSIIFNQEAVIQKQSSIIISQKEELTKKDKQIKRLRRISIATSLIAITESLILIL